jgi:hypothetical protein
MTPQLACIDLVAIFGEKTPKAFIPPTVFRNAVGKLQGRSGVHFRPRQPSANGNGRTIDNRGHMVIHRLHTMGCCRFCHSITADIGVERSENPDLTLYKTRARLDPRGARSCPGQIVVEWAMSTRRSSQIRGPALPDGSFCFLRTSASRALGLRGLRRSVTCEGVGFINFLVLV